VNGRYALALKELLDGVLIGGERQVANEEVDVGSILGMGLVGDKIVRSKWVRNRAIASHKTKLL
jgi:hypothetical protein